MASGFQSTDLLASFNALAARPTPDTAVLDATKYQYLAQAQDQVIIEIANISGNILYGNPTLMASTDGGYTYNFGIDGNGYPSFLLDGHVYPTLQSIPWAPWIPGRDYLDEGDLIRAPNGVPFAIAPYFQGITSPQAMNGTIQPILTPPYARILIPIRAVQNFSEMGKRDFDLANRMQARWQTEWARISVAIRKHLRGRRGMWGLTTGLSGGGSGGGGGGTGGFGFGFGGTFGT